MCIMLRVQQDNSPAAMVIGRCGGINKTAALIGVDRSVVNKWLLPKEKGGTGGKVPPKHWPKLLEHLPGLALDQLENILQKEGLKMTPASMNPGETRKIRAGEWLITEGGLPAYFLYRLTKGKVGVYEEGEKLRTIEVANGGKPHYLGFMSSLGPERQHSLSVKIESDAKVEVFYIDHIRGLLRHDVPVSMRGDIDDMIETIIMGDHIKAMRRHLARKPRIDLNIGDGLNHEIKDVLEELKSLYEEIIGDKECLGLC